MRYVKRNGTCLLAIKRSQHAFRQSDETLIFIAALKMEATPRNRPGK